MAAPVVPSYGLFCADSPVTVNPAGGDTLSTSSGEKSANEIQPCSDFVKCLIEMTSLWVSPGRGEKSAEFVA